tara:strand:- start:624 stop:794 length:171 start_codon:yes stop_codon:yes gene_type:complete
VEITFYVHQPDYKHPGAITTKAGSHGYYHHSPGDIFIAISLAVLKPDPEKLQKNYL